MPVYFDDTPASAGVEKQSKIAGRILDAFDQACQSGDHRLALRLLGTAESVVARNTAQGDVLAPWLVDRLVSARARLWTLKRHK